MSIPQTIMSIPQTTMPQPTMEPHSEVTIFNYIPSLLGKDYFLLTWEKPLIPKADKFLYIISISTVMPPGSLFDYPHLYIHSTYETKMDSSLSYKYSYKINIKNLANGKLGTTINYPGTDLFIPAQTPIPT